MRTRNMWGILGSTAGVASSLAALAYFTIALVATTAPALANPPNCTSEQVDLAIAEVDEDVDYAIYMYKFTLLANCMMGPGPCTSEEVDVAIAQVDYMTSADRLAAAEFALMMCEMGGP